MTYLIDIGNVLLSFDFEPALKNITGPNADPQAFQKIMAAKDPFEAGKTQLIEYLNLAYPLLDFRGTDEEFAAAWRSIFTPIMPMWELIESLAQQSHRLILFSNTNEIHAPSIVKDYAVFKHFHHAVFSHEIKAIKPNNEFYTRAFEKFQIIPEETIYIDDLAENIEAGRAHGLKSFCYDYNNHQALLTWLKDNKLHS